jgi:hypothetical protein
MVQEELCRAIQTRHLVQFYYTGDDAIGNRVVEPHMVAYTRADNLALSAWLISGVTLSSSNPPWRTYLLDEMSSVIVLPEIFFEPRPEYQPDGGKTFHNVVCAL